MAFLSSIAAAASATASREAQAAKAAMESGIYEAISALFDGEEAEQCDWEGCTVVFEDHDNETSITMADGTVIFKTIDGGRIFEAFRPGKWVERFKAFSEQAVEERENEAFEPFSDIDF